MSSLTLLVPAFNEEANLRTAVRKYDKVFNSLGLDYEIIIVNDGSTDKTLEVAMDLIGEMPDRVKVVNNGCNKGLGYNYRLGVEMANNDYFLMLSGEGDILCDSLVEIINNAGRADMIIPYIGNPWIRPDYRRFITWAYTLILNTRFGFDIKYYNGFVLHKTGLLKGLRMTTNSFAYQAEIIVQLIKKGHSYIQIPYISKIQKQKSEGLRIKNIIATFFAVMKICARGG